MKLSTNIILPLLAIIVVLWIIFNTDNSNNDQTEPYAPNIDNDFNQYAPAYDYQYLYENYYPSVGWLSRRGLLPWWNSTRDTKNMSYDIRGDILPYRYPVGPWLNSTIVDSPYRYRTLY